MTRSPRRWRLQQRRRKTRRERGPHLLTACGSLGSFQPCPSSLPSSASLHHPAAPTNRQASTTFLVLPGILTQSVAGQPGLSDMLSQ